MGLIIFKKRGTENEEIDTDFLLDISEIGEALEGMLVGDDIRLSIYVSEDSFNQYRNRPIKGATIHQEFKIDENAPSKFKAVFDFKVIRRVHSVLRDWMNKYCEFGFRVSTTMVYVESISDEAEEIFSILQTQFRENANKRLELEAHDK